MSHARGAPHEAHGGEIKASDLFVRCLEAEGVEYIFGLPGEENADLMMSLMDSKVKFILTRQEQGAAFMADLYGRLSGKPGVCLATLGPGATNLVTGLADANMDRSPVVAIIGQASTRRLHKESHQNMDAIRMMRPLAKWAQSIVDPAAIPEVVRKAFKLAIADKPGVAVIELPEDVADRKTHGYPMDARKTPRPAANPEAIAQAVELLLHAKNPMILAGNGALRKRASAQLRRFAQKSGMPVFNTFMGKGALRRDDPHNLFTIGLQGKDYGNRAMETADVLIVIGYDLVEYSPHFWNPRQDKKIVHVDFLPAEVDNHYPVAVEVVGDIADALWQINLTLEREHDERLPLNDIARWQRLRTQIQADHACEKDDPGFPIKPQKILWDVREFLSPSDILISDVGAHKMWISRYYPCDEPNTCIISNGFCSMGIALPGAIGAKFACPDKRVLAICGDGGFLMNVQDLETAVRLKLNVVILIWQDGGYGLIKWKQISEFGRHSELDFLNPEWELLAKAFGCWGRTICQAGELPAVLREAFEQPGPALIGVPVDYRENLKLTKRLGAIVMNI